MTTTNLINEYLNMTPQEYNEDQIQRYMRWCENLSKTKNIQLQSAMANSAISNYYTAQFREIESGFLTIAKKIERTADYKVLRNLYASMMTDLYLAYPGALLEAAKNLNIENPPYAN